MTIRTILATLLLGACGTLASCSEGGNTNTTASCGDNDLGASEACDGSDFGEKTCESLGFGPGSLSCASDCSSVDTSACGAPASCGDGTKDGVETCDGADLGGQTCAGVGLGSGNLGCQLNCLGFDSSNCSGPATCGNGQKDGVEVCDGPDLGGATCESAGFGTGPLACASNCIVFDTSGCVCAPACGGLECGLDPQCGESCGDCALGASCEAGKCVEICDLPRLLTNKTLDLDAKTVMITGKVTLNGAAMPNDGKLDGQTRGRLRFRNVETGDDYDIDFGETGAVTYSVTLFAGVYDVYIHGNYETVQSVLPGARDMKVQTGLSLVASKTADFDAKTLKLSGNVTLNGAAMPNDTKLDGQSRGRLRLRNMETFDDYDIDFAETGAITYSQTIFAGMYDIYVHGNYETVQSVLPGARDMIVQKNLALSTTTTKDFDAKTLKLSGSVTLNGASMPNDTKLDGQSRGRLRLRNIETGDDYDLDFGETGAVMYSQTMFTGLYDVFIHGNYETVQSVLPGPRDMMVQKKLALTMSTTKKFDAKTLTLSGKVTLNGAPMPNDGKLDGQSRGRLRLRNAETFDDYDVDFAETGPVNYSQKLFAGLYDVYIHGNYETVQSVLPGARDMMVQKALPLTTTISKDFDAKTLTLSGKVTLNGAAMPSDGKLDGQSRGRLRLRNIETFDDYDVDFAETGPVNHSQRLFAGLYDVYIHGNYETVQSVLPGPRDMMVQKGLSLMATMTKDFDAKTLTVTGKVTLNGAPMPTDMKLDGQTRGRMRFRNAETFDDYDVDFGETGPITYSQKLFAGAFDVFVHGNYQTVQSVLPGARDQRLLKGCLTK